MLAIGSAGSKTTSQSVGGVIATATLVSGAVPVFVTRKVTLGDATGRAAGAEDARFRRELEAVAAGDLDDELLLELLAAHGGRDEDRVRVRRERSPARSPRR